MKRNSYHTSLKLMVQTGKAPQQLLNTLPRTTIHRFKNSDYSTLIGTNNAPSINNFNNLFDVVNQTPGFYFTVARIHLVFINIFHTSGILFKTLRLHKPQIVTALFRVAKTSGVNQACKWFKISTATYRTWRTEVNLPCGLSPIKKCFGNKPNQLTSDEVTQIKHLLTNSKYSYWSIQSIALYARRENLVHASFATWYKYNKLLGLRKFHNRFRKEKYVGLTASFPNEYWHADVSIFKTRDGFPAYIYAVIDNYSRKVLAWNVSEKLKASIRVETIKEAYNLALTTSTTIKTKLIVDGGCENNNKVVDLFVSQNNIQKLIALKDINFSNSMVEAVNKQMKYNCLFRLSIQNIEELKTALKKYFYEHNQIKPLAAINGYLPDEVYFAHVNKNQTPFIDEMIDARTNRIEQNRITQCKVCV